MSSNFPLHLLPHRASGGETKCWSAHPKYTSSSTENPSQHSRTHLHAWEVFLVCTLKSDRLRDTIKSLGSWLLEPSKLHPWRAEVRYVLSLAYNVLLHWLHVYRSGWYFSTIGIQILITDDKDEYCMSCNTTFSNTICRCVHFVYRWWDRPRWNTLENMPG